MLLLPIIEDELPCSCNGIGCQCTNPVMYDGEVCEQCRAGFCDIDDETIPVDDW